MNSLQKNIITSTVQPGMDGGEEWDALRLDTLHPVVSGNKIFKLLPWLELAGQEKKTSLLTFGGPWSNHIVATAFAAREQGLASMGIIRGEPEEHRTATLEEAADYGMTLRFLGRSLFRAARADGFRSFAQEYPEHLVIPEGGAGEPGALGLDQRGRTRRHDDHEDHGREDRRARVQCRVAEDVLEELLADERGRHE